jgi:hypothetical protein
MKTVKLVAHVGGRQVLVSIQAENAQEAIMEIMSERFYGADQDNGDTEVLVTDNIGSFTLKGGL